MRAQVVMLAAIWTFRVRPMNDRWGLAWSPRLGRMHTLQSHSPQADTRTNRSKENALVNSSPLHCQTTSLTTMSRTHAESVRRPWFIDESGKPVPLNVSHASFASQIACSHQFLHLSLGTVEDVGELVKKLTQECAFYIQGDRLVAALRCHSGKFRQLHVHLRACRLT